MAIRGIKRFKKIIRSIKKSDVKTIEQQKNKNLQIENKPKENSKSGMVPQISIREVCEILSLELPNNKNSDNEKPISIDKLRSVCVNSWGIKNYAIFFLKNYGSGVSINNAVNVKGKMIVDHKTYRNTGGVLHNIS